jgi:hypothetical protein
VVRLRRTSFQHADPIFDADWAMMVSLLMTSINVVRGSNFQNGAAEKCSFNGAVAQTKRLSPTPSAGLSAPRALHRACWATAVIRVAHPLFSE